MGKPAEIEFDIGHCGNITRLEHVIANISYSYYRRGDVKIVLISPSGTPSDMLSFRENDKSERGKNISLMLGILYNETFESHWF